MAVQTEHFPTAEEAVAYRMQWNARMKELYRKTVPTLRALVAEKHDFVLGGPVTKEDHIKVILEDEYPAATLNEAIHVIHHRDWFSDACEWCAAPGTTS